jgi:hypothetical protein
MIQQGQVFKLKATGGDGEAVVGVPLSGRRPRFDEAAGGRVQHQG